MKTLLATLNAKYIHTSLALRWLYVANKDFFDIQFKEYTIKENIENVADDILISGCQCVGLGVYIWNVEKIKDLVISLRAKNPDLIILLGGPEVTYEPEYFLKNWPVDYVISGEGEFVLGELLQSLEKGEKLSIAGVSSQKEISTEVVKADLQRLSELPSPYQLPEDTENCKNRLVYFETSRGCPYQCAYCLSSLEKGIRYFPENHVKENLKYLVESGAKQIKFLDRTFNLNWDKTHYVFDFLIDNYHPGLSCQFEVYADLLTDEMIDYLNNRLPEKFFRFEIGIQSTHEPSNEAVNRKQDFALISRNIRRLMDGGKIDLHLDLIAGLPHENYQRFAQSLNDVFAFRAKELQLGFLKMLRGTSLRKNAEKYGYLYHEKAPYEVISNNDITAEELDKIRKIEHVIDKYWNTGRFKRTLNEVFDTVFAHHYFEFFAELADFSEKNKPKQASLEESYACLNDFLLSKEVDLFEYLRNDYYDNFSIRPASSFWKDALDKKERKRLLMAISKDKLFLEQTQLTAYSVKKQARIDLVCENQYLLTLFLPEGRKQYRYIQA